ncbi:hypothetical protein FMN63_09210 [Stappia sp. BW2]|uniref:hypothetical protein n=1 Tax=Stappia sp. BW2 TaxID=2592622 RepID=UPI0011DE6890|nr:hypothetical protein [Stappia sp. BW2]TYC70075.1 hypothetical protein FMN63_09210 [Stappia sp. BW2]
MLKRLLSDSVSIVFGNLETVFKVCGGWFLLQFVLSLLILANGANIDAATAPEDISGTTVLLLLTSMLIALLSSASISVAWHRFGLLNERPGPLHFRVGAVEFRFIGQMLLLSLAAVVVVLPAALVIGVLSSLFKSNVLTVMLWIVAIFILAPFLFRLNLSLPAVAVERPLGFSQMLQFGKGLGMPMFLAALILILPFVAVGEGLQYLLGLLSGGLPAALIQMKILVLNVLVQIIVTVLGISILTAGYRIAMERPEGAGAQV